jgi:hypothetical protein
LPQHRADAVYHAELLRDLQDIRHARRNGFIHVQNIRQLVRVQIFAPLYRKIQTAFFVLVHDKV